MAERPDIASGSREQEDERPIVNVVGELVALGPMRRALIPTYQRWVNDLGTMRNIGIPPRPMTEEAETAWYDGLTSSGEVVFTIYDVATWQAIGTTALHGIDFRNRTATFGIMIGEKEFRGRGCGTETTRLMLDYAFTALGLHSLMLTVFSFNLAGQRAYEKAGFREIGRRRQARWMGGRLWDEVYMDCLATEFSSPVLGAVFSPDAPQSERSRQ